MNKIPTFVQEYLWDVPKDEIDPILHSQFIIERVLEYGDFNALFWLNKNYKITQIKKVLKESKKISPKSGNFYAIYYHLPKSELLCIRKPFTQKQNRF